MTVQTKPTRTTLLRAEQVLERLQISRATLYRCVKAGHYPSPVHIGKRAVRWRAEDIETLIQHGIR